MRGRRRRKTGGVTIPPTQPQVRRDALFPAEYVEGARCDE